MLLAEINQLLKTCLLPELKHDLDSIPIEKQIFEEYQKCLNIQLPLLFDWVQQQQAWIYCSSEKDRDKQELQSHLIILLCELSSRSIYELSLENTDNLQLVAYAKNVLNKFTEISGDVQKLIFEYYQQKLHKDFWKRQLGAVHGFVRYLEFNNKVEMSHQFLTFSLSVGLLIRCHETHYKHLSTRIFQTILRAGPYDVVVDSNIHGVIYDAVFKDIAVMDSKEFIVDQWNALIKCLDFSNELDSFTWNAVDDLLECLIRNITLAPDSQTSICLLKYVAILMVYFTINRQEFENAFTMDFNQIESLNSCRTLSGNNTSFTCYRWAKSVLQMFVLESYKLLQTEEVCIQMLKELHVCYIFSILPIALDIVEPHVLKFFDKFTAVLMEVVNKHKFHDDIVKAVTYFLETFLYQLKSCDDTTKLGKYKTSYRLLIQQDCFNKFSTI